MKRLMLIAALAMIAGCAANRAQTVAELNAICAAAGSAISLYAGSTGADAARVAEAERLLTAAEAAVSNWAGSTAPADQQVADGAIAALQAYEQSLIAPPAH